ncbi:hypothetical protein [Streptomyces albicerus]|uniref:hypothetical protein n=1 Tax=Streptomyces albicerus TaxID=2569859 RepID=UPI00124AF244|nr:hypothetical protein [Streptomyces albicerus]
MGIERVLSSVWSDDVWSDDMWIVDSTPVVCAAAIPVLLAVAIPGAVMPRRVRQQRQAGITPS